MSARVLSVFPIDRMNFADCELQLFKNIVIGYPFANIRRNDQPSAGSRTVVLRNGTPVLLH